MNIFFILALLSAFATLGVLGFGVINMGKKGGAERSNKMMRLRILFQVLTILFLLLAVLGK